MALSRSSRCLSQSIRVSPSLSLRSTLLSSSSLLSRFSLAPSISFSSTPSRSPSSPSFSAPPSSTSVVFADPEISHMSSREEVEKRVLSLLNRHDRIIGLAEKKAGFKEKEGDLSPFLIRDVNQSMATLGLDSLDQIEFIVSVENEFGLEIEDDVHDKLKTVKDVIDFIVWHPQAK